MAHVNAESLALARLEEKYKPRYFGSGAGALFGAVVGALGGMFAGPEGMGGGAVIGAVAGALAGLANARYQAMLTSQNRRIDAIEAEAEREIERRSSLPPPPAPPPKKSWVQRLEESLGEHRTLQTHAHGQ